MKINSTLKKEKIFPMMIDEGDVSFYLQNVKRQKMSWVTEGWQVDHQRGALNWEKGALSLLSVQATPKDQLQMIGVLFLKTLASKLSWSCQVQTYIAGLFISDSSTIQVS